MKAETSSYANWSPYGMTRTHSWMIRGMTHMTIYDKWHKDYVKPSWDTSEEMDEEQARLYVLEGKGNIKEKKWWTQDLPEVRIVRDVHSS